MTQYTAPIQESLFTLDTLHFTRVQQLADFADSTQELVEAVLEQGGKFATEVFAPINQLGDTKGVTLKDGQVCTPAELKQAYQLYVENGWLSLSQPTKFDGQGLPFTLHIALTEYFNSANMALALNPMLSAGAIDVFLAHASDSLQQQYLPHLISGKWTGTMNLTEPQAGSDLSALRTKARLSEDGSHYLIKGQKIYITWGDHDMAENIVHIVLAPLDDAPDGIKGLSLFAVPKYTLNSDGSLGQKNDVQVVSIEHKLGIHASPTCVMSFGESTGAVGYMIGKPGEGLACMFTLMNHARVEVGVEGLGLSESAYQSALSYAQERVQGRHPITNKPTTIDAHSDVKRMLFTMKSLTDAMRGLCFDAAISHDFRCHAKDDKQKKYHYQRFALLTPITKAWCTELVNEVTSLGIQVYGGMGYVEETGVAQLYRDARITSIYEGTTGIQAHDLVLRKLIHDKGTAFDGMMDELQINDTPFAQPFVSAKQQLEKTARYILDFVADNPTNSNVFVGGVAYDFLMQMGYVLGGWYHVRYFEQANKMRDSANANTVFLQEKQTNALFYLQQVLPRASMHAQCVMNVTDTYSALVENP